MAKLTFHGGVNEIGGNKILLEDGGTRILFDFGMSFSQCRGSSWGSPWYSTSPILPKGGEHSLAMTWQGEGVKYVGRAIW